MLGCAEKKGFERYHESKVGLKDSIRRSLGTHEGGQKGKELPASSIKAGTRPRGQRIRVKARIDHHGDKRS